MSEVLILPKMMPVVGLRELVYAKILTDTAEATVYDDVKQVLGIQGLSFKPNSNQQQAYGDDGTFAVVNSTGEVEGEMELNTIPTQMEVDWFGRKLDANGAEIMSNDDQPNQLAVGFRARKSDGGDKLVWLYKITPAEPEVVYRTKEGTNVTIQNRKIAFKAIQRESDRNLKTALDSDKVGLAPSVVTNWTKAVYEPVTTPTAP